MKNDSTPKTVETIKAYCESILDGSKNGYPCDGDDVARCILEMIEEDSNEK